MGRFLIWLSGANRELLVQTNGEFGKYEGLGGVVLTTATMAALSAGLAINLALQAPILVCLVIGLGWGLAILNLDRWLISAFPRRDKVWKNLLQTLPRFVMALIIGLVVSTPLVLKVFDHEINDEIRTQQTGELATRQASIEKQHALDALAARVTRDKAEIAARGNQDPVVRQDSGVSAAGRLVVTARQAYKDARAAGSTETAELQGELKSREREYTLAVQSAVKRLNAHGTQQLPGDQARLKQEQVQQAADLSASRADVLADRGLITRTKALESLRAHDSGVNAIYLVLWAFITLVEILPVLLKFLMTLGAPSPYEIALVDYNAAQLTRAQQHIAADTKLRAEKYAADAAIAAERERLRVDYQTKKMQERAERRTTRPTSSFGP